MLSSSSRAACDDRSAEQLQVTVMRAELAAQIERHTAAVDGIHLQAIPQLALMRLSQVQQPSHTVYQPSVCLLAQGSKRVLLNDEVYVYDTRHYLVVAQNLPVSAQVIDATPQRPYLGLKLEFDPKDVAAAALEIRTGSQPVARAARGICTCALSTPLLDAVLRLVRLLDTPEDIGTLAPLCLREILYRVLKSPDGWRLAQMAVADSHSQRITHAIHWLQRHFDRPLHIEALAREVHMSASSLHSHFKAVTAMSPLQFQKQLRLQEARRLMLAERLDAGTAGHRVGYESQSQFNREYSRFFGAPPARDIRRLIEAQMDARQAPASGATSP